MMKNLILPVEADPVMNMLDATKENEAVFCDSIADIKGTEW
jgi:hypothetical protein